MLTPRVLDRLQAVERFHWRHYDSAVTPCHRPQPGGSHNPALHAGLSAEIRSIWKPPVPSYIRSQASRRRAQKGKAAGKLFETDATPDIDTILKVVPDVALAASEYEQNPLAADVKFWGHYVLALAKQRIGHLYPDGPDGSSRMAYLWANTLPCPNPACRATVPLSSS